jgi:UDP-N-acetylmuramoyl-tripeptide--D-alanyl-D-alanine ligase
VTNDTTDTAERVVTALTASEVARDSRSVLVAGPRDRRFTGVSIDSRTAREGELFVAIRGPRNDGHDFLDAAISKGAGGVLVDEQFRLPSSWPEDRCLLRSADSHFALKNLAAGVRRRWGGSLVGITGSMGKTTTKEFCGQLLESTYRVFHSPGNLNNLFGLPLALLGVGQDHQVGIFEMGMSEKGEIAEMCRIAAPEVGVVTNIAPVHLESMGSVEAIAEAKNELVQSLPSDGCLVYNADDPLVCAMAERFGGEQISFGTAEGASVRARHIELTRLCATQFLLDVRGSTYPVAIPLGGLHYVMNTLAAVALSNRYGIDPGRLVHVLGELRPAAMRGGILRFRAGFTVIDDSYNSNPRALAGMIATLSGADGFSRRILIAGEMLELGPAAASLHRECGREAARAGIDVVVAIQGTAGEIAAGAVEAGLRPEVVHFFDDVAAATDFVRELLTAGDLALIKGSRGVHLEKLVESLRIGNSLEVV